MKHLGDIRQINGAFIPAVDCITGGSPCQDLSIAGKRAGLAGERSGLFMEQMRVVREMREHEKAKGRTGAGIRPRYMVWENVPGAFSSGQPKGADFAAVLEEIIKVCEPRAAVSVCVPDKGWPQSGCYYDEDGTWSIAWRVHDAQFWGVPQRRKRIALVADFGGLSAPEVLFERKGLHGDFDQGEASRQEAARGTGASIKKSSGALNPWDYQAAFKWNQGAAAGSIGYEEEVAPTLNAEKNPAVYDARGNGNGNTSPTLTGDHQNRVTDYTALCVGNGQLNNISMAEQVINTLTARNAAGGQRMPDKQNFNCIISPEQSIVRRLTPLECERLQGFPDGWTDIGEWTDSKRKKRPTTDTARYKALGNSIALPFWFWLLRRISAQYERPATLGSLFDGIGGFPLCWERCNGKGTALWASEIEEFPMAVTKFHFGIL